MRSDHPEESVMQTEHYMANMGRPGPVAPERVDRVLEPAPDDPAGLGPAQPLDDEAQLT